MISAKEDQDCNRTRIVEPNTELNTDLAALKHILRTEKESDLRLSAATRLLRLVEEGECVDADIIRSLYQTEQNISVATELKRILNKLGAISRFNYDPAAGFDRNLTPTEESSLRKEIDRLRGLYDQTRQEPGAFERNYRVECQIAEGGMGKIFRGVRLADNRLVAIKFLMTDELAQGNSRGRIIARFRREGELLTRRIKHPNIIEAFEYGESDSGHFLVMEYLTGGTLHDRIKDSLFEFDHFKEISSQLCAAVDHLHRNGIIHRDIHPANIMFIELERQRIKLCDFGLARDMRDASLSRIVYHAGTDEFSSPQQLADARSADERDDIYSLGKTFYMMLTGRKFTDLGQYRNINEFNPDVLEAMDDIVRKCCALRREDRFTTIAEVRNSINLLSVS